jgi:hypothetical protein
MATELIVWLLGIALGYFVRRNSREHDIVFLVTGSIAIGAFVAGVSGEIFDFTLYLILDVLQALVAAAAGYYGPLFLNSSQRTRT